MSHQIPRLPINNEQSRRQFLRQSSALLAAGLVPEFCASRVVAGEAPPEGFRSLFNGKTLTGWHGMPRPQGGGNTEEDKKNATNVGRWTVEDGIIVGGQEPPGSGIGGYLVSDEAFGDFELLIDARPDWAADTGVLVRTTPGGNVGFQILLDHRRSGGIGGFYGNGLAGFHAIPYEFTAVFDKDGRPIGLQEQDPATAFQPVTDAKRALLSYAAPIEEFLKIWKFGDWNTFRIRSVGELPQLTTWINGTKICEMDTAKIVWPGYKAEEVLATIGRRGHISLEVHSNGANDKLGKERWAPGAVCRWRNIFIKTLDGQ